MSGPFALLVVLTCLTIVMGTNGDTTLFNRTHENNNGFDTGFSVKGPIGTVLYDILLRVQQHDQEQRLDAIRQVQQSQMLQQQLQRQVNGERNDVEQMKRLQANFTDKIGKFFGELHEIHHNLTLELRHRKQSISVGGILLGCFNDASSEHDLPHDVITSNNMTHQLCIDHCFEKGYKYAAVQNGHSCYCGNSYGRYGATLSSCNRSCPGDPGSLARCGGVLANTIIGIAGAGNRDEDTNILMQQHYGGTSFFSRTWVEFKSEFGHVDANYWIGNDRLHQLTKDGQYGLRVDLLAKSNNRWYWAAYDTVRVSDEASGYALTVHGFTGNAGNALAFANGAKFSTKDRDNDMWSHPCATHGSHGNDGGFWYTACSDAYLNSPVGGQRGFIWDSLPIGSTDVEHKLLVSRMTLVRK